MPGSLRYVSDAQPGIQRVRRGRGFAYRRPDGSWLRDPAELERIRRLAIPPAYQQVWICPLPEGHLQATGRDARGRKQYRYHPDWHRERDEAKFERMLAFGQALPRIRAQVEKDLEGPVRALTRERVLATIVRLLDTTFVRIGNEEYVKANRSYGLTTLRNRHAAVRGSTLKLHFTGKSGVRHQVSLDDPRVARVIRRCQALPGHELFEYEDDDGTIRAVGSTDVNDYLQEVSGDHFTAKDFRTWHASVHALDLLRQGDPQALTTASGQTAHLTTVLKEVASRLGNTVAVCRKSYVHPKVLSEGLDWVLCQSQACRIARRRYLQPHEQLLLQFLAPAVKQQRQRGRRDACL